MVPFITIPVPKIMMRIKFQQNYCWTIRHCICSRSVSGKHYIPKLRIKVFNYGSHLSAIKENYQANLLLTYRYIKAAKLLPIFINCTTVIIF